MSDTKQVTPSGAIGKQVFDSTIRKKLVGILLDAPTSASTVEVRDGNASGQLMWSMSAIENDSRGYNFRKCIRFDKGMHVEVIGLDAKCYLEIE